MAASTSRDSVALGDLYARCVQLVNENKVSTKNAFDLPLIDNMDDIVQGFMGGKKPRKRSHPGASPAPDAKADVQKPTKEEDALERRFHEASCTIEASARIYACRVDCVHTDTYRILGGLSAANEDEDAQEEGGKAAKKRRVVGVNTLERNEANITQNALEMDEESDPTFRRMAAAFDAGGAKGLLLSKLPIVEDLSLVFNGDVPLARAADNAQTVFARNQGVRTSQLGCGDTASFCSKLQGSKLCPELDHFRQNLWGDVGKGFSLPGMVDKLMVPGVVVQSAASGVAPLADQDLDSVPLNDATDAFVPDLQDDLPEPFAPAEIGVPCAPGAPSAPGPNSGVPFTVPLMDDPNAGAIVPRSVEDAVVFEQLFDKFCGKGQSQFAYFEEFSAKQAREQQAREQAAAGALVAADDEAQQAKESKQRGKREKFDFSELQQPVKPMETEPAHRHQISERASAWQLHKNVPPYMLDRITMPCWPPGKCNFASLALRPHLMMKLVRREVSGEGPHNFSDLYGFVAVENADAFPWLRLGKADGSDDIIDAPAFANRDQFNRSDDEDAPGPGFAAPWDVNPAELFLQSGEKVVGGEEDLVDDGIIGNEADAEFGLDLVSKPATVDSSGIGYSRNAKFVDVKLVKKNLWSCIVEDITDAKARGDNMATSFQELVNRTVRKMPASECDNLSVQVCFICALHICNERSMEVKAGEFLKDFELVAPEGRVKI